MPRKQTRRKKEPTVEGVLGVGLDGTDGQKRVTRTPEMVLVGGSQETHEQMQDVVIRFNESLEQRGKRLQDASLDEVVELLHKASDH
jgi:hypothetical protein